MMRSLACPSVAVLLFLPACVRAQDPNETSGPPDGIANCEEVPECARFLEPPAAVGQLSEADRVDEAVVRAALLSTLTVPPWEDLERVRCVGSISDAVRRVLLERFPVLVPDAECELGGGTDGGRPALMHRPTGRPALRIQVRDVDRSGDRLRADVSYYVGPLHAAGWICELEREGDGWRPRSCRITWVS